MSCHYLNWPTSSSSGEDCRACRCHYRPQYSDLSLCTAPHPAYCDQHDTDQWQSRGPAWNEYSAGAMISYIPAAFYQELLARSDPVGCGSGECHANGTEVVDEARSQWDKFSQSARIGIIVGAAVGATLVLSVLACCLWRCCRKRHGV